MAKFTIDLSRVPPQRQGRPVTRENTPHPSLRDMPKAPGHALAGVEPPQHVSASSAVPPYMAPEKQKFTKAVVESMDRAREARAGRFTVGVRDGEADEAKQKAASSSIPRPKALRGSR